MRFTFDGCSVQVRCTRLGEDGDVHFCLIDAVQCATGKENNHAAHIVRRIMHSRPELRQKCVMHQFAGQGQRPVLVGDINALTLTILACPGKAAERFYIANMGKFSEFAESMHRCNTDDLDPEERTDTSANGNLGDATALMETLMSSGLHNCLKQLEVKNKDTFMKLCFK